MQNTKVSVEKKHLFYFEPNIEHFVTHMAIISIVADV